MSSQPLSRSQHDSTAALHDLRDLIARHAASDVGAVLPGAMLLRVDEPSPSVAVVSEPMLCLVAQGAKRIAMGQRVLDFGPSTSLVVTMAMPVSSEVILATATEPYLAVGFPLDIAVLAELVLALPVDMPMTSKPAVELQPVMPELLATAVRLLGLLDHPEDVPVLGPLVTRELLYHLLKGPHGAAMRELIRGQGGSAQIARAVAWIRRQFAQPLRIAELAAFVSLSESALHRNFKAVTGMTPQRYQQQIRLTEARTRLLAGAGEAAAIGYAVGYNSPSQFSREYARLFGRPPARDVVELRMAGVSSALVW